MNNDYEKIFNNIIDNLKRKNSSDISNVIKAYNFAKEKHKNQFRKSGQPYILHPVQVASILEHLDFNTDVISAGLLHDTVEDCGVTIDEIQQMFNRQIAQIVDAVTAITKESFKPDTENIYSDTNDFHKLALEDKTYQKLISIGKLNKFGFYIKLADRLNNLQTIEVFPKYKQEEKVIETKKWIIPIAKLLKSKYFYENLKNECFLISQKDNILDFINFYENYKIKTQNYIKNLKRILSIETSLYLKSSKSKLSLYKVVISQKTQLELYNLISQHFETNKFSKIKECNFFNVPTYNIYVILNEKSKNPLSTLYDIIDQTNISNTLKVIGINTDEFNNTYLTIKDNIRNLFNITMLSRPEFTEIQNGTIDGTDIDLIDETMSGGIDTKYITVYSSSNEKIRIPAKSTVLDFAFKLHQDIGFSCKYAYINNSPNKSPIYTRLNNGDKIDVICQIENGLNENIAQLRWLAYCKNEYTQRILIKYFEKKYNQ